MNYIVLDLEWNQTCAEKSDRTAPIPFEIIEIGAVKLTEKQEILGEFHEMIRPRIYPHLNETVQQLIQITEEELAHGRSFPEVFSSFLSWCGEEPVFCTWGSMDLVELQRNMKYYHFPPLHRTPFFYYDVQKLFSIFYEAEKQARTLSYASDFFHLKENGHFHSAIADARYTARIFQKMQLKKAKKYMEIDYFHPPRKSIDEIYVSFSQYSKYISMEYKTKEALMHAKNIRNTICCICQTPASRKIDWFTNNAKNYYGVFYCKAHGYLKGKIRIKKSEEERYFAVKTIKIISKEEALQLKSKKEEIHKKKKATPL